MAAFKKPPQPPDFRRVSNFVYSATADQLVKSEPVVFLYFAVHQHIFVAVCLQLVRNL